MTFIRKIKSSICTEDYLFSNKSLYNGLFTFINSHSYLIMRKNKSLLSKFDGFFFDGLLIVKFINFFYNKRTKRISFDMTSLAPKVFNFAIKNNKSIYFVGSKEDEINGFINVIKTNFIGVNIAGYRNGFFTSNERIKFLNTLAVDKPDIVIVGMGTPLQEKFLVDLSSLGWRGLGFTCGGFIHQTSNNLLYYPAWINKYNLRWLYRLYDEPKLIRRFLRSYIGFPFIFLFDFFKYQLSK